MRNRTELVGEGGRDGQFNRVIIQRLVDAASHLPGITITFPPCRIPLDGPIVFRGTHHVTLRGTKAKRRFRFRGPEK